MGVALFESFETSVGRAVHANASYHGGEQVHHVVSVIDRGRVINPSAAQAQVAGSVIYEIASLLYGEAAVDGGEIQQTNFPDYDMLRRARAPDQEVHFRKSEEVSGGLGEPALPHLSPAFANAFSAITGGRIRSLPITKAGRYAACPIVSRLKSE